MADIFKNIKSQYSVSRQQSDQPHHNRFTAIFPGPPGRAGARRELLDYGARED